LKTNDFKIKVLADDHQNLKMLASMSGKITRQRIEEVLEIVGLKERANDAVRVYSHGMKQRLGIAQALLPNPEFVILDEPTNGLDPQGIREMRLLIRRLCDELGLTVMLSSHLLNEVEQLCNRLAIIDRGRLLYQGSSEKLVSGKKVFRLSVDRVEDAYNFLVRDSDLSIYRNGNNSLYVKIADGKIADLNTMLVEKGFRVKEISPQRETLEQVFLRLTE
jgi:ABC-2 type transport system ATP-binding protein